MLVSLFRLPCCLFVPLDTTLENKGLNLRSPCSDNFSLTSLIKFDVTGMKSNQSTMSQKER